MHVEIKSSVQKKDVVSILDFTKDEIIEILNLSEKFKKKELAPSLNGAILASCFFEPSTRTRLSFESAMLKLGGNVIGFSDDNMTSVQKGESLHDTIKVIEPYADVIVIRHPKEGAPRLAADIAQIPVINAGDGANQHPTQTLIDLYSIWETQGTLEQIDIAFVGDLKYSRCVHSLAQALCHFPCRVYFVSPKAFEMPMQICKQLRDNRVKFSFHQSIKEIISKVDILYMTRYQEERFSNESENSSDISECALNLQLLRNVKENMRIMHPLPRRSELPKSIDLSPFSNYFEQAKNGLYVRQALLSYVFNTTV